MFLIFPIGCDVSIFFPLNGIKEDEHSPPMVKCNIPDPRSFDDKSHTSRQKFSKSEMEINAENQ